MERYKIKPQLRVKEVENHSGMIGHRTKDNLITRFRVVFASCHFRIMSRINVEEWKEDGDYSKRYENSINCIPTNFFIIHLFTCAYIIWVVSPSCPHLHLLPSPASLPGRTCSVLFSSSLEE
jgi:hypothetical protein